MRSRTSSLMRIGRSALAALAMTAAVPASAQIFLYEPTYQTGNINAEDPLVGVALPGANPNEYRASLIWNLRSGLNVAALQCQFSPYLRTVDNYNGILAHHSTELASAYQALEGYFRRVHGRTGPRRFDDYSTQTYNNFSTFQAQFGFCQTAARIGKEVLGRRKGEFHLAAAAYMRELRSSLTPAFDQFYFTRAPVRLSQLNLYDCSRVEGRERRQCERDIRRR
ncbi:MAG: hypothetical protein ACXWU1_05200 [Allosphingosinicella sp.]